GVDPGRIVLYGGSMGAATVLNAAGREPPGVMAAIADSSYASFAFQAQVDGADKGYPAWVVDLVVQAMDDQAPSPPSRSRPDRALLATSMPILLLQCSNDERVTVPNFEHLVQSARTRGVGVLPAPITMTWLEPCPTGLNREHHLDGFAQAGYNGTVLRFLWDGGTGCHPPECALL